MNEISVSYFNQAILSNKKNSYKSIKQDVREFCFLDNDVFSINPLSSHYRINQKITSLILSKIPTNFCSVGFKKGCSYLDLFQPHLNSEYFLRLDIKKFFHSIPQNEIELTLKSIFPESNNKEILSPYQIAFNVLTFNVSDSHKNKSIRNKKILPMGFPSSPALSNILFRRIDILIQKECERLNVKYTRYADDMLFSSSKSMIHNDKFVSEISYYISLLGLKLNNKKTIKSRYILSLNGYTIDTTTLKPNVFNLSQDSKGEFRLSNKILKKYAKLCYFLRIDEKPEIILKKIYDEDIRRVKFKYPNKDKFLVKYANNQLKNKLVGTRSFLISVLKFDYKNDCMHEKHNKKISDIVSFLEIALSKYDV